MNRTAILTTFICAAGAGSAQADIVNMYFKGTASGRNVRITESGQAMNVFAGQLRHQINGAGAQSYLDGEFLTYCVDISEHVSSNTSTTYNTADLTAVPARNRPVDPIVTGQANALRYAFGGVADVAFQSGLNAASATAYQLAAWEIVTDYDASIGASSFDLTSGSFTATRMNGNALWSDVTTVLSEIQNRINLGQDPANLMAFTNPGAQDQITAVPTPGVASLAAIGGLAVVTRRRR